MRLGIRLLNSSSTVNNLQDMKQLKLAQGETSTLMFQLIDYDQNKQRYMPQVGATLQIAILRNPLVLPDPTPGTNSRIYADYSIKRAATQTFPQDASVFSMPLTATDTATMTSTNFTITLTEGSNISIATLTQAIRITNDQDL